MTRVDDLELVVQLAMLTEARERDEQRALLRLAAEVDRRRNERVVTNPDYRRPGSLSRLYFEACGTWQPDDDNTTNPLPRADRERIERAYERWENDE